MNVSKIDIGKEPRRGKKAGLVNQIQKSFMNGYLVDHQDIFVEVMDEIREGAPAKYAELYLKMYQINQAKETNINLTMNVQKDVQDLFALAKTKSQPKLGVSGEEEFVSYEELRPEGLPVDYLKMKQAEGEIE